MVTQGPLSRFRAGFERARARSLARLSAAERAELQAFDAAFKRHGWQYTLLLLALWTLLATVGKLALAHIGWIAAFVLSGALLMTLIVTLAAVWFGPSRVRVGMKSVMVTVGMALTGALVGAFFARLLLTERLDDFVRDFTSVLPKVLVAGLVFGMAYAVLMVSVAQFRRMQLQRQNADLARQASQERMGRQLADARLRLMQAQVEPHFLFNTLASVQQLAEGKAPEAAQMTARLITFLRAGLAGLREEHSTLGREFKAIEAYLEIMRVRMPERLSYQLDLPAALAQVPVPPAMLISLVENAIKHGIEPFPEAASIRLRVEHDGRHLRIEVRDTGLGPNMLKAGGGVGLDNIRQRLRILYAGQAHLTVGGNAPRGFVATIEIPHAGDAAPGVRDPADKPTTPKGSHEPNPDR